MAKSITQLGKEWKAADNVAKTVGGREATAAAEAARQALANAAKGKR
ncbi:hypothetical protein [Micromonospora sp. WMMD737]